MCCHLKPMKTKVLKAVLAVYIIAKDVSPPLHCQQDGALSGCVMQVMKHLKETGS